MDFRRRKPAASSEQPPDAPGSNDAIAEPARPPLPKRTRKRSLGLTFAIGGLVGLLLAGLAKNKDMINIELMQDLRLDALADVIPVGVLQEMRDISRREEKAISHDAFSAGLALKAEGLTANYPVVMIPGVISTGLESWGTEEQSRPFFRKRLWGSWSMLRLMVTDRALWKQHIMLDHLTGMDPPGIKLRAAQGLDASDFFITGYWIWSKIIENLASIGYDPTSAYTAAYDWRLGYSKLEESPWTASFWTDRYFSRLKTYIETAKLLSNKKVVLVSHSMGSQVVHYFFKWAEAQGHGGGGPSWVEDHIEAFINISGCMLGAVKGLPAVLSGEMKDTVQLNQFAVYGLEKFFSREDRAEIMRSMPGLSSMLPKGGDAVWGNLTWAPDDDGAANATRASFGNFARFTKANATIPQGNMTLGESIDYLLQHSDSWFADQVLREYSHGIARTRKQVEANENDPRTWVNPLESRLPNAPSLKIYCFYGIGKPTERAYYFRSDTGSKKLSIVIDGTVHGEETVWLFPFKTIAIELARRGLRTTKEYGVITGEGDGTVGLLSSGYMCTRGWKMKRYNPAGVKVTTVEMVHEPERFDIRGGPNTGDHVDILGRQKLNELILRVAAGQGDSIKDNIESRILEYAERVEIEDDE